MILECRPFKFLLVIIKIYLKLMLIYWYIVLLIYIFYWYIFFTGILMIYISFLMKTQKTNKKIQYAMILINSFELQTNISGINY